MTSIASNPFQQQAQHYLLQGDYDKAAALYEQAIAQEPQLRANYWHLGLIRLLQGQEGDAQITWMSAMLAGESEQITLWTRELLAVLQAEAERRETTSDWQMAWVIRQHIREIAPEYINNLLRLLQISTYLELFNIEDLAAFKLIENIQTASPQDIDEGLLLEVLEIVLEYDPCHPLTLELAEACLSSSCEEQPFFELVMVTAERFLRTFHPDIAVRLASLCLRFKPDNLDILFSLSVYQQFDGQYTEAIDTAKHYYALSQTLVEKVLGSFVVLSSLMRVGGYWQEACAIVEEYKYYLSLLLAENPQMISQHDVSNILPACFFLPYFQDSRPNTRHLLNRVAEFYQTSIEFHNRELCDKYHQPKSIQLSHQKVLRIGYISDCFRHHSVGWLSRWVFKYHNPKHFQIYTYFTKQKKNDSLYHWFVNNSYQSWDVSTLDSTGFADRIYEDEIDILVDLDSITSTLGCQVMALKPAPIQVTWLGWDASGLPTIDYYIADAYVLPESAQADYPEKIWRLPQTYIAVDGFEVGVPTVRREDLGIPDNAVIYLTSQIGFKRHPDTIRLQMQIIKQVPNSYLVVKGFADEKAVQQFFEQIAAQEGVESDRLRFLPLATTEVVHRANLSIADVVLDTYPYNGATTTLETLWMGIPLVTRVGEQFAARNSYTMMMNAGVTAGIAWTDDEYVEWGVSFGKNPALRQQITWQLQQSRQTAPLWDAQEFTLELEKAYQQMWIKYLETH
ncbi:O-linked N-acetylglucosamine transferase, SPINDLY family protein [Coleofasciculus sp. F4-SAH-05]|uniref:O-linked N-acetylglucosamine transferase, SPINDLY family protein n=1 Tax=Coleofasciculus sp. F4-SAH-05 TaxID=3069525 RepID=UPI00330228BF